MGQNGMPFAPMLEAAMKHQSVEGMVKDHLMQIISVMGQRFSVSLIVDDLTDPNNCGVLSGPGAAPWRTVVASINAAIQTKVPLPEHDRTQIAKTLGLQAAAVVTAGEKADFLFGEVDRLKLTLMRLRSFCDDGGKEIIKKALGAEPGGKPERKYADMLPGDMLSAVGTDARTWADAFVEIATPEVRSRFVDEHEMMVGWFANAIETARGAGAAEVVKAITNPENQPSQWGTTLTSDSAED